MRVTYSAFLATDALERLAVMTRILLVRGMLVGLVAGLVGFTVAKTMGESSVGSAIGYETRREEAAMAAAGIHDHADAEVFSRTVQNTIGLFTGTMVFAIALGGIFALVFAVTMGRLGRLGARPSAALVALAGFTAMYLIPIAKYPANPPAANNAETIGRRSELFFLAMSLGILVVIGAVIAARRLTPRLGIWNASVLVGAGALAVLGVSFVILPGVHETPSDFPATTLWNFRIASLAIQLSVWTTIGLLFGWLTDRALRVHELPAHI
jgi:predicted cobalt transporter CbtA